MGEATSPTPRDPVPSPARDTADPPDLARARVTAPRLAQVVPLPVALLDLAAPEADPRVKAREVPPPAAADPRVRAREVPPTAAADPRVRARAHLAPVAPRRPARARAHLAPAVPTTLARPVLRSKQMKRSI